MRLMSFALTTAQLLDGSKTVTRRVGWANLKPGDRLKAVRKAMGLKPGEKVDVLAEIEVVSVRRERLDAITPADVLAEGFPAWTSQVAEFVEMFCSHMTIADGEETWDAKREKWVAVRRKVRPNNWVTRIEFRIVPGTVVARPEQVALPGVST